METKKRRRKDAETKKGRREKELSSSKSIEKLDLMQCKRMLQLQTELIAAAAEEAAYNAIELTPEPKRSHVNAKQNTKLKFFLQASNRVHSK